MKKNRKRLLARLLTLPLAAAMTMGSVPVYAETQAPDAAPGTASEGGEWNFTWFGTSSGEKQNTMVEGTGITAGTDLSRENNGAKVSLTSCTYNEDGTIGSKGGKFVATDPYEGLSFYYTKLSAAGTNFYLQADVTVDYINPSPDGQEGFALIARDSIGEYGVSELAYYTNMMETIGTKASYLDTEGVEHEEVKDVVGWRWFTGVKNADKTPTSYEYDRYGFVNDPQEDKAVIRAGETYRISLEETDSGYIMSYYDKDSGQLIDSHTYYKEKAGDDPLAVIDKDYEYVGFAAARGCNATFSNIIFRTSEADDSKWEKRPNEYVAADYQITSPSVSNGSYELVFKANADGTAKVINRTTGETIVSDAAVKAGEEYTAAASINTDTVFAVEFTPNSDYRVDGLDYKLLDSYDTKTIEKNVTFRTLSGDTVYVSADGKASNSGESFEQALDLETALNYAKAGQTIVLKPETYTFQSGVKIPRGLNGMADQYITVQTDPDSEEFAVFDFNQAGSGLEIWGNYWHFKRINVTNSVGKGGQLSGSHNILEQMNFYNNGNTGLQVSGSSAETIEKWPSYNTIKNCTSMNNADAAEEDADGFAAKLTTGEGNVFDGCIAAYNADDGWDLFAKTATGSIGAVTIKNSIAYRNGFLIVQDASKKDVSSQAAARAAAAVKIKLNGQNVTGKTLAVTKGTTYTLKSTASKVTWKSSNKKVATVTSKGRVKIVGTGKVKITVTADGSKKSVTLKAAKTAVKVSKIKISGSAEMKEGTTQTLKAVVTPASAKNQNVTWKSNKTSVAAVDAKGVVTAKKEGTAVITAKAKDGSAKKAELKIKVTAAGTNNDDNNNNNDTETLDLSYIAANLGKAEPADNTVVFDGKNYGTAKAKGANITFTGVVKNSGNGNGFKMGGSAMSGKHVLKNSISYENKAKGIDSNSGPDIQVYNSTSFNNGGANAALYSNSKIVTDFVADGVISYRKQINDEILGIKENISLYGQTDLITTAETNYLWDTESKTAKNALGKAITDEMFVSLDTAAEPVRNADGSIDMHGLLTLTNVAPGGTGADLSDTQADTTLWVVGDSTVSSFSDKYYIPRYGWGTQLSNVLNYHVAVENLAVSGTSSKSFLTNKNYQTLLDGMKKGDYLIIGFGHNDEKEGDTTFTSGNGSYQTEGSFAKSLYDNYILKAQEKGVEVILVTPIVRLNSSSDYTGSDAHITANGDYAKAVRDLGTALGIPVCDLTAQTAELVKNLDTDTDEANDSKYMHAWTSKKEASLDKTHTNMFGAAVHAYMIGQDLKNNGSSLADYLIETTDPMERLAFWKEISINADYEEPVYNQPTAGSSNWDSYTDANGVVWHGSVFGDVGSGNQTNKEKFALGTDADANMHISAGITGNTGKVAGTSDGLAMYYVRIPAGSQFSLKADVTLNSFNEAKKADKQQAFGLMVRDDMYVDEYIASTMGDYVAAGTTIQGSTAYNTYARKAGVLTYGGGEAAAPEAGKTTTMEIASTADGYSAKYGDNAAVIEGYDFSLNAVDGDYVYAGFFASRSIDISVSNIELTIDGQKQTNWDCYAAK